MEVWNLSYYNSEILGAIFFLNSQEKVIDFYFTKVGSKSKTLKGYCLSSFS